MTDVLTGYVERGAVPGAVALVARGEQVHVTAVGSKTIGDAESIGRDTLFRIASMTKPVTVVAALSLVEECRLRLDDPVDDLLPELSGRRVLRRFDGPVEDTVPADRPITVRDLVTFRMGFGMVLAPPGTYPIQAAAGELLSIKALDPVSPDEWLRRLGTLPLMYQPGHRWMYDTSAEVLGILVARASGRSLETCLRERIFEPLGMVDTGFDVPAEKLHRLATGYLTDPVTGGLSVHDRAVDSRWSREPLFPSGAGNPDVWCLVSTVDDYLAFARMLMSGGVGNRSRVLSRPTVETMTTDQLSREQRSAAEYVPGFFDSRGWGMGVAVVNRRTDPAGSPGAYGWDGGLGTSWLSDPREDLVTILMTQAAWTSPSPPAICRDFRTTAYSAIDD
jgi:CubicO group peptidase (beta-lactamase class C family)